MTITNESLVNITLTSVTVVLAVLATIIGVVSLVGYRAMKGEAKRAAESAALIKITEYLDSAEIKAKLREVVDKRIAEEGNRLYSDLSLSSAFPPSEPAGSGGPALGTEYPEEEEL